MLDLDPKREGTKPTDAATLIVVRDHGPSELQVFCVERSAKSRFMGGAIVFPGGKLDDADKDPAWERLVTAPWVPRAPRSPIASDDATARALAIAGCREALEEAAILPVVGKRLDAETLLALRHELCEKGASLRALVAERELRLDLSALRPFSRWVTPAAEARRFDARFYLVALPAGQEGAHDHKETTQSFWASPSEILKRFDEGTAQLAPPQHRLLSVLATVKNVAHALALAEEMTLDIICPELVTQNDDSLALVLPGDPQHSISARRIPGKTRYVMHDGRFIPADPT
jgi:8-oxo-dGTP pyrophosphatase MutT (NUDIX family)